MIEFARVVVLLMGGFALGLTLVVLRLYQAAHKPLQTRGLPLYHIPLIAVSHSLLILALISDILHRVATNSDFQWWVTPVVAIAFPLSISSHVQMLRSPRLRGMGLAVRRAR